MHYTLRSLLFLFIVIQGVFGFSTAAFADCCDDCCFRICDVLIRCKCENDFKRVSEYFTGREDRAGRTILRTDEDCRDGVYFVLWLNCCGYRLPQGSRFELEFIPACTARPVVRKVSWVLECCGSYTPEVFLGLTGEEWDDYEDATDFLAWKISLFSPEGKLMASRESFLWRHSCSPDVEPRLDRKEEGAKAVEVKESEDVEDKKDDVKTENDKG